MTFAPIDWNETMSSVGPAPVLRKTSRAVRVTKLRELDRERVDLELERLDGAAGEDELEPDRLVVRRAVGVLVVRGLAVGDRRGDRLAREELRPAGGDVDRAVEGEGGPELDGEVRDADAEVVELEDRAERDLRAARVGLERRVRAAEAELGGADREAVPADDEPGDRAGRRRERRDRPADVELRERDADAVDPDELLVRRALRVVLDEDPGGRHVDDVLHVDLEPRDAEAELLREPDVDVAAEEPERVDLEVERPEHADELGGDRVAGPEDQLRAVDADRDREDEHALVEADVGERDARAEQLERAVGAHLERRGRTGTARCGR